MQEGNATATVMKQKGAVWGHSSQRGLSLLPGETMRLCGCVMDHWTGMLLIVARGRPSCGVLFHTSVCYRFYETMGSYMCARTPRSSCVLKRVALCVCARCVCKEQGSNYRHEKRYNVRVHGNKNSSLRRRRVERREARATTRLQYNADQRELRDTTRYIAFMCVSRLRSVGILTW